MTKERYNDPTRILPMYRTCNAAKGNASVGLSWSKAQVHRSTNVDKLRGLTERQDIEDAYAFVNTGALSDELKADLFPKPKSLS